jgi:hypothetical protein
VNKGWLVTPGNDGFDADWASRDDALVVADDVEHWLHDLTMHNTKASDLARAVVESSRKRP